MTTRIIARKNWANAAAFIEINENGDYRVYSKFYTDGKGHDGPTTPVLGTMPPELLAEAQSLCSWLAEKSPELEAFCDQVWQKAKEIRPWFGY